MKWYSRRPSRRKSVPPRRTAQATAPDPEPTLKPEVEPEPEPVPEVEVEVEVEPVPEPEPEPEVEPEMDELEVPDMTMDNTRGELNEAAREAGVESPEKLPNKQAVLDALDTALSG